MNFRQPPPALPQPVLTGRQYAWCAAVYLVLAVYGSLVPFHYEPLSSSEAIARFQQVLRLPLTFDARTDWATNVLLFIPLSFLLMAAVAVDRSENIARGAALVIVPCCVLLSTTIEFTQLFFPLRTSSLNDIAAESLGAVLGALLWLARGQSLTAWARGLWTVTSYRELAARLLPGYLAFLAFIHLMPFDLTMSPVEIYHKYRAGQVLLLPFSAPSENLYESLDGILWLAAYYAPLGMLLAFLARPAGGSRNWSRALLAGWACASIMELLKLFVMTRFTDTTNVLLAGPIVLAGWASARRCLALREAAVDALAGRSWCLGPSLWICLPLCWLLIVLFVAWQPFDFTLDRPQVVEQLDKFSYIPFADYYEGTEYSAFDKGLHQTLLFMPLGVFLAPLTSRAGRGCADLLVLLSAAALACGLEAGQVFLPSRFPSVTDVLIEMAGAWLGFAVACRVRAVLMARSVWELPPLVPGTVNSVAGRDQVESSPDWRNREFCR